MHPLLNSAPSFDAATERCLEYLVTSWRSFRWSQRVVSAKRRPSLISLLAWNAMATELAREPGELRRRRGLEELGLETQKAVDGSPRTVIGMALRPTIVRYGLPVQPFRSTLLAWEREVLIQSFETRDELAQHAARLQSALSAALPGLWELHGERDRLLARTLGTAVQLARWIADYHADLPRGHVRIPVEEIVRRGVTFEDLVRRPPAPGVRAVFADQIRSARESFAKGWALTHALGRAEGRLLAFALRWHAAHCGALEARDHDPLAGPLPSGWMRFAACAVVSTVHRNSPFAGTGSHLA